MSQVATKALVLIVNVGRSWPEVVNGTRAAKDAVLGDWCPLAGSSATKLDFEPADVGLVLAYRRGQIVDAYDVTTFAEAPGYPRRRVRFDGIPSQTWSSLINGPSPVQWVQGDGAAHKTLPMHELAEGTADVQETAAGTRAVLGDVTVMVDGRGEVTVSVPAGRVVHVRTLPAVVAN